MVNPAHELLDIFHDWSTHGGSTNQVRRGVGDANEGGLATHVRAMALIGRIELEIDRLEQDGRRVTRFRDALPDWIRAVLIYRTNSWTAATPAGNDFPELAMATLDMLADTLDHHASESLDPVAVANLRALLDEVVEAAKSDDSLSERLRTHIIRAARHLQTCVDEFDVMGSSRTMEALDALWVAAKAAEAESSRKGFWAKFAERFFYPTAAGLLANGPSLALQIAASAQASGVA